MSQPPISHALVLPEIDFKTWLGVTANYTKTFERVAIIRSPKGNDLNRYRNITAVQVPGVWVNDDAFTHIRRTYPLVVRIDIIDVDTPAQLAAVLQERITTKDRYGEKKNDGHIHDRFILDWPSEAIPARIVRPFNNIQGGKKHEGLDIYAPRGTTIRAAAPGTVATLVRQPTAIGYGQYVQVGLRFNNENYLVTYALLEDIRVSIGQQIKVGDIIGVSSQDQVKIVVQKPGGAGTLQGYILPDILDPTLMIYWQNIRLKPTDSGVRIRERPGTDFKIMGQLSLTDRSETLEPHGHTLLKIGKPGQWIKIRSPQNIEGFAAAEYLIAGDFDQVSGINMTGMNLDLMHPLGKPAAERLKGLGWVRFAYNVSMGKGSTDLEAAYNFHAPHIDRYAKAGLKVMLVLTHQTFGEGAGYNWNQMDTAKWRQLTTRYADFCNKIAARFAGRNMAAVYQIWNEQDTAPGIGHAAVSIPPVDYAFLMAEAIKAIKAADPKATIITGGHVGGPGTGVAYARATLQAMPSSIRPDGIACHSYGRGVVGHKYSPFGSIDEDVNGYSKLMPGVPIWITEWGVLDRPNDPASDVENYALGFLGRLKTLYSGKVSSAIWYAWADTMHNGYGLIDQNDKPKQPLYERFLKA